MVVGVALMVLMHCSRVDMNEGGALLAVVGGAICLLRVSRNVECTGYL